MKNFLLIGALVFTAALGFGLSAPQTTQAAGFTSTSIVADFKTDACNGLEQVAGNNACTGNAAQSKLNGTITDVVNLLTIVVGVVAVVMITIAGFKYITSGGESSNVSGAKNALIYALVGLFIVAVAQGIVRLVLKTAAS